MQLDERFILGTVSQVSIVHATFPKEPSFCVDSRTLCPGDIFVAVSGVSVDGHDFIQEALIKGAAGCIIAQKHAHLTERYAVLMQNKLVLIVPDTLKALFELASAWRDSFTGTVIGITGTVGKTSTKELVAKIVTAAGISCIASKDNQNTKIGLALNILRLRSHHGVAVMEVGISKRGEMAELVKLLRPTTGIITNIGHQHMDGLGSLQDIALEKRMLFKNFTEHSVGIINGDQPLLSDVSYPHPVLKFGLKTTNQIEARKIRYQSASVQFLLKVYGVRYPVTVPKPHLGSVFNSLAATAVAQLLEIPHEIILKTIQEPCVVSGRFEERAMINGGTLIDDCYNANPESMKLALLAFQNIKTDAQKIVVLGDMLGLGSNAPFWHRQIGRFLRKISSVKRVILVGNQVSWIAKTAPMGVVVDRFETWCDAVSLLKKESTKSDMMLVKGSHDVGLRHLVDALTK